MRLWWAGDVVRMEETAIPRSGLFHVPGRKDGRLKMRSRMIQNGVKYVVESLSRPGSSNGLQHQEA